MIKSNTIFKSWEQRRQALAELHFETFNDYLKSPLWLDFKRQLLDDPNFPFKCKVCGAKADEKTLDFHHMSYEFLGDPERQKLVVMILCREHHLICHKFACLFPDQTLQQSTELFLELFNGKQNYAN